jgi:hypothetical protein
MEDVQDVQDQAESGEVKEQMTGLGYDPVAAEESSDSEAKETADKDDPYSVKKRLGMQAKRHQREMRAMQEQLAQMQAHMSQGQTMPEFNQHPTNPYPSSGQPNGMGGSEEERIQKAIRYAFQAKDDEERRAREAQSQAHVQRQYQRLNNDLDKAADKYEDFDEVVRGDTPYSQAIRDALLLVENPGDVAYKLGKNRQELDRILQLHPIDQAREVNKLSVALISGNGGKQSSSPRGNPLNPIRNNPVNNSSAVTDKTPPSVIRARMKAGTWK